MMTILTIASAAVAAVQAFRALRRKTGDNAAGSTQIKDIRQGVAVVLAFAEAAWAVLDALLFLAKPKAAGGQVQVRPLGLGSQVASDVST